MADNGPSWDSPRPVPELPRAHRPRQKLLSHGAGVLASAELLDLAVGSGAGRRLLSRHGLRGVATLSPEAWRAEPGVGPAAAVRLAATFEVARRAYGPGPPSRPRVSRPREAWRHLRYLAEARKEHLVGLYLDAQNGLLQRETISVGSLNTTRSHPREILYPAVAHLAAGFILAHNHPSGCLEPSPEDLAFTRAVRRAGELMGIELYDHLIVARDGYTSLRERGAL